MSRSMLQRLEFLVLALVGLPQIASRTSFVSGAPRHQGAQCPFIPRFVLNPRVQLEHLCGNSADAAAATSISVVELSSKSMFVITCVLCCAT